MGPRRRVGAMPSQRGIARTRETPLRREGPGRLRIGEEWIQDGEKGDDSAHRVKTLESDPLECMQLPCARQREFNSWLN